MQPSPQQHAARTWKALARRLSPTGNERYKAFDPESREYKRRRKITDKLPDVMAAVDVYSPTGLTTNLVLDFDSKEHGPAQVDADFARAARWIRECGGRILSDRSTGGGRHLIAPLAIGTSATVHEMRQLADQLRARLRTLDPKPTKSAAGCISVPGTRCSGGGYRLLDGTIDDAIATLTERSEPGFLPALYALLGTLPTPASAAPQQPLEGASRAEYTDGHDDDQRILQAYWWTKPFPADVLSFAADGVLAPTWPSPSEGRQAVVTNAVLRGFTRGRIRQEMQPGASWSALGDSYRAKHGIRAETQFERDFDSALQFAITAARKSKPKTHGENYSHFSELALEQTLEGTYKRWLGYALAWTDHHFQGKARWSLRDVWQSLAVKGVVAGELREGIPVVGVGGRSISLSTGLLSHKATATALRRARDMVGAPVLLNTRTIGREPDVYALVTVNPDGIEPIAPERVHLAAVHPAWSRIGRHHRAVYELIVHNGMTDPAEIFAAAKVSQRSGHYSLTALAGEGLIHRRHGHVTPGPVTLDAIADEQHLEEIFADRLARYRRERQAWHTWLAQREQLRAAVDTIFDEEAIDWRAKHLDYVPPNHAEFLESVMSDLPPPDDEAAQSLAQLHEADSASAAADADEIALLGRLLGATVLETISLQ